MKLDLKLYPAAVMLHQIELQDRRKVVEILQLDSYILDLGMARGVEVCLSYMTTVGSSSRYQLRLWSNPDHYAQGEYINEDEINWETGEVPWRSLT